MQLQDEALEILPLGVAKRLGVLVDLDRAVIEKILRHCGLWNPSSPRAPPAGDTSVHDPDEPPEPTYVDIDTFEATF